MNKIYKSIFKNEVLALAVQLSEVRKSWCNKIGSQEMCMSISYFRKVLGTAGNCLRVNGVGGCTKVVRMLLKW